MSMPRLLAEGILKSALTEPAPELDELGAEFEAAVRRRLERTHAATPGPKWVVAAGACALDGGLFAGSYACVGGVDKVLTVDIRVSGCPPTPMALLKGLLALMEGASRR